MSEDDRAELLKIAEALRGAVLFQPLSLPTHHPHLGLLEAVARSAVFRSPHSIFECCHLVLSMPGLSTSSFRPMEDGWPVRQLMGAP
jgi:hypothetical protein